MVTQVESPALILARGCRILDPILEPRGFVLVDKRAGVSSGGSFASCKYVRGNRVLELHYRGSLGLVTYHVGELSLDHRTYTWAVGVRDKCAYPDFPKDPLDSFGALARDIENFCSIFLGGADAEFEDLVVKSQAEPKGFSALS